MSEIDKHCHKRQVDKLKGRITQLEQALAEKDARVRELEAELERECTARDRAETDLGYAGERIQELEATLREIAESTTSKPNWKTREGLILVARKALEGE